MPIRFLKHRRVLLLSLTAVLICAGGISFGPGLLRGYRLHRGRKSLEARDTPEALEWFRAAERIDPGYAETQFLLARGYRLTGRSELFGKHLKEADRLGFPRERLRREELLAFAQSGDLKRAEPGLSFLLQNPEGDGPAICEAYAGGYLVKYKIDKAYQLLDAWKADYPEDAQPHFLRGMFLEQISDWKGAVEEYRAAYQRAPARRDVVLHLAGALARLHQYDEASRLYRRSLKEQPNDSEVLLGWGKCLLGMGNPQEARKVLSLAIDVSPDRYEARLVMGQLEQSSGNTEEALKWLVPVVEERPYDVESRYALARALQETGDADGARAHFQFVAEAEKAMIQAQILVEKVRAEPDNSELRYQLGKLLLLYDNPDDGAGCLQTVLDQNPNHEGANRVLADFYGKRGNQKLADEHRARLRQLQNSESVPGRVESAPQQEDRC